MSTQELTTANGHSYPAELSADTLSALVLNGDLSKLNPGQQVEYYRAICDRVGLDPATQPFKILNLQGKKTLYCDRGGVAQLCKSRSVSHKIISREKMEDLYVVTAQAKLPDGRETESIGAVNIQGLKGENLANAMMKAETKAKRRATLDLVGLGMLDESETGSIPGAITESLDNRQSISIAPEAVEAEDKEHLSRMRAARAQLVKLLTPASEAGAFTAARGAFQKEYGKGVWEKSTCHNDTETFSSLAQEIWDGHEGKRKAAQDSEAYVLDFARRVEACADMGAFLQLEAEFKTSVNLPQDQRAIDALYSKGREFEIADYMPEE